LFVFKRGFGDSGPWQRRNSPRQRTSKTQMRRLRAARPAGILDRDRPSRLCKPTSWQTYDMFPELPSFHALSSPSICLKSFEAAAFGGVRATPREISPRNGQGDRTNSGFCTRRHSFQPPFASRGVDIGRPGGSRRQLSVSPFLNEGNEPPGGARSLRSALRTGLARPEWLSLARNSNEPLRRGLAPPGSSISRGPALVRRPHLLVIRFVAIRRRPQLSKANGK